MPSISSRLVPRRVINDGEIGPTALPVTGRPPLPPLSPPISATLRSPLPNLVVTHPDSLRQFYAGGAIPQYRFAPLTPLS